MDTYTLLRSFADSWWLLAMMGFFVGVSLYALRPGSAALHADIARIPLRDDEAPEPAAHPSPSSGCGSYNSHSSEGQTDGR